MNAYDELLNYLKEGEQVEAIVFGAWGWGFAPREGEGWELEYDEPNPPPVPFEKRGKVLTLKEAEPYMKTWKFSGGYGAPKCYAVYVWTNKRVIWVTQYDGATWLCSAPRNPTNVMPDMPGGG